MKHRPTRTLSLLLGMLVLISSCKLINPVDLEEEYEKGMKFHQSYDWQNAYASLNQLTQNPDLIASDTLIQTHLTLAMQFSCLDDSNSTMHHLNTISALATDSLSDNFLLAQTLKAYYQLRFERYYPQEIIEALRKSISNQSAVAADFRTYELLSKLQFEHPLETDFFSFIAQNPNPKSAELHFELASQFISYHLQRLEFIEANRLIDYLEKNTLFSGKRFQLLLPLLQLNVFSAQQNIHLADSIIASYSPEKAELLIGDDKRLFEKVRLQYAISRTNDLLAKPLADSLINYYLSRKQWSLYFALQSEYSKLLKATGQFPRMMEMVESLKEIASTIDYPLGLNQTEFLESSYLSAIDKTDQAILHLDSLIQQMTDPTLSFKKAHYEIVLLNYYLNLRQTDKALNLCEKLREQEELTSINFFHYYLNIYSARIKFQQGHYSEAHRIYAQSLRDAQRTHNLRAEGSLAINLGVLENSLFGIDSLIARLTAVDRLVRITKDYDAISEGWFYAGYFYQQIDSLNAANRAYYKSASYKAEIMETAGTEARKDYLEKEIGLYFSILRNYFVQNDLEACFNTTETIRSRWLVEEVSKRNEIINIPEIAEVQQKLKPEESMISYTNVMDFYLMTIYIDSDTAFMQRLEFKELILNLHDYPLVHGQILKKLESPLDSAYLALGQEQAKANFELQHRIYRLLIDEYRSLLQKPLPSKTELELLDAFAQAHYELHLGHLSDFIKSKTSLIVIPSGYMGYLPFETFRNNKHYLIEDYSVRYSPSVSVWQFMSDRNYPAEREEILAFGNADYEQANRVQANTKPRNLREINRGAPPDSIKTIIASLQLPNLDGSKAELKAIKESFNRAKIYSGSKVEESTVKKLNELGILSNYKILHLSTHGIFVPYRTDLSSLIFPIHNEKEEDGLLNVSEIANLKLQSDLAVLSACETGLGDAYSGEGIAGIAQAFLIAGSKNVAISLWSVSDRSTADFFEHLYGLDSFQKGNFALALQETKKHFLRGTTNETNPMPFHWAPFILHGN